MNVSRETLKQSTKPFIAWAAVQGQPETLKISFHVSARAAERGADKLAKSVTGGLLTWGWSDITESDRRWGKVL